nr:tRNA (adenosine(37)-N6)-threonylcarbamoyltransferase complex ATPase subunit type 1 TsaE [Tamilnaduibacter salinus]
MERSDAMGLSRTIRIPDETATEQFGALLAQSARQLEFGVLIYLHGDLGMGKTTLARGLVQGLGHPGNVKSPTYTLVEPYDLLEPPVYHFDLYRLADPEELEFMGIRDYLNQQAISLVEWPERGAGLLPGADVAIELTPARPGRMLSVTSGTQTGQALVAALSERLGDGWIDETEATES